MERCGHQKKKKKLQKASHTHFAFLNCLIAEVKIIIEAKIEAHNQNINHIDHQKIMHALTTYIRSGDVF